MSRRPVSRQEVSEGMAEVQTGAVRSCVDTLIPTTLKVVRRCPARSDYVELCFTSEAGAWTWCVPEPVEESVEHHSGDVDLAMITGPYGAQARCLVDGELGFALPSSQAMALIVGECRTYVTRKLVERGC